MAEYIERFGWKVSDIGSKKIIKMVDYEAMRVAFDEKFKETMQLIESGETHLDNLAEGFHEADGVIFRLPAADVAPVVHGRWKYYHKQNKAVCTNCSFERDLDANFGRAISCPNCGAKMDVTDINVGNKGGESHETKERGTEVS